MAEKHFQIHSVSLVFSAQVTTLSSARSFSIPVVLAGTSWIPPATAVNYIPWALIGFIFNYGIRKRHFNWWAKYNCEYHLWFTLPTVPFIIGLLFADVLSAALDSGTAIGTLMVFFA
jgi:hypothetical protein